MRYSPDGKWITCSPSYDIPDEDEIRVGLCVIDAGTGELHLLFNGECATLGFSSRADIRTQNYAWLPDSRQMLVTVGGWDALARGYVARIWLVNLDGEARQLGDGRVLTGSVNGRVVFIYKDEQVYRVEFD